MRNKTGEMLANFSSMIEKELAEAAKYFPAHRLVIYEGGKPEGVPILREFDLKINGVVVMQSWLCLEDEGSAR